MSRRPRLIGKKWLDAGAVGVVALGIVGFVIYNAASGASSLPEAATLPAHQVAVTRGNASSVLASESSRTGFPIELPHPPPAQAPSLVAVGTDPSGARRVMSFEGSKPTHAITETLPVASLTYSNGSAPATAMLNILEIFGPATGQERPIGVEQPAAPGAAYRMYLGEVRVAGDGVGIQFTFDTNQMRVILMASGSLQLTANDATTLYLSLGQAQGD